MGNKMPLPGILVYHAKCELTCHRHIVNSPVGKPKRSTRWQEREPKLSTQEHPKLAGYAKS